MTRPLGMVMSRTKECVITSSGSRAASFSKAEFCIVAFVIVCYFAPLKCGFSQMTEPP